MKNYKKIEHFEPIVMKCTKKQFEEIKPILDEFDLNEKTYNFNYFRFLVNNSSGNKLLIANYDKSSKNDYDRKYHKTFNAETFLKACGIVESEPTTKVRNSVLLQLADNNSFSEEILRKECPKLFESKKLEYNRWYKFKSGTLGFFQGIGIKSYGFHFDGNEWINDNFWFSDANLKIDNISLSTPQEVETALVNEAKKRGLTPDNLKNINCLKGYSKERTQTYYNNKTANFEYEKSTNTLWLSNGSFLSVCIFNNGQWTKIIETPTDIITIVEKYGKDKVIELVEQYKK